MYGTGKTWNADCRNRRIYIKWETVELVRSFDPVLVIAGSENGVPLATHLADELGLPGNPWKNIDKMINEEALEFCRENGFTTAADVVATRL